MAVEPSQTLQSTTACACSTPPRQLTDSESAFHTVRLPSPLVPAAGVKASSPRKMPEPTGLSTSVTVSPAGSAAEATVTVCVPVPASIDTSSMRAVLAQP